MKYQVPILFGDNIELKKPTLDDYMIVYEYDFRKLTNIWEEIQYVKNTSKHIEKIFLEIESQNDIYSWIIFYNDKPVGHIVADRENKNIENSIELSYNLHPDYWGKGIMKSAVELVCSFLLQKYDNIIISYCTGNEKSEKLLKKLNLKYFRTIKCAYKNGNKEVDEYQYILKKIM